MASSTIKPHNRHQKILAAWQKIVTILAERTIAFQKIMIYNRRRSWLRIRRRQAILRMQYIHRLIDIQNKFLLQIPRPVKKRIWREPRNTGFWDNRGIDGFTETEWLETFRVSLNTFKWICERMRDDLHPKCSSFRNPIPLEKRVAMSLYKLASGAEYRVVSEMFGVARSTVCKFVRMFCEAVVDKLSDDVIEMPAIQEASEIAEDFESISDLPLIVGSVGITHIPVNPPSDGLDTFINASGWPSIVLQGMVDNKFVFRKVDINSRDPSLFTESTEDLPKIERTMDNERISCYIVGTSIYPLHSWLMKQYSEPKSAEEEYFNKSIQKVNDVIDEAFRRLFSRWRVLSKKVDIEYRNMAVVISACCTLHNIIEQHNDGYNENWPNELNPKYENLQPKSENFLLLPDSDAGNKKRTFLSSYLSRNFL